MRKDLNKMNEENNNLTTIGKQILGIVFLTLSLNLYYYLKSLGFYLGLFSVVIIWICIYIFFDWRKWVIGEKVK